MLNSVSTEFRASFSWVLQTCRSRGPVHFFGQHLPKLNYLCREKFGQDLPCFIILPAGFPALAQATEEPGFCPQRQTQALVKSTWRWMKCLCLLGVAPCRVSSAGLVTEIQNFVSPKRPNNKTPMLMGILNSMQGEPATAKKCNSFCFSVPS